MNDVALSPSKEARKRRPYRSLYAAVLLQSFEDALAEAMPAESPIDREVAEAAPRKRRAVPAGQSTFRRQT